MELDTYASGAMLIGMTTAMGVAGLLVVRRTFASLGLASYQDVGGYLLSIVGTIYAVILGLIVVESMSHFQEAHQTTEAEANALADIVLLANPLPSARRQRIQHLAIEYADLVVNVEWPAMDQGHYAPQARRAALALIDEVTQFEPTTESEKAIYAAHLTAACQLWDSRRVRTVTAEHGVPALEWVVLMAGGMITVAFTYFFKVEHLRVQAAMTALVTLIISLNIYLVSMFGYPFSGDLHVDPSSFKVVRQIIERPAQPPSATSAREQPRPTRATEAR